MSPEIAVFWQKINAVQDRYPPAAFSFVQEGLRYTVETLAEERAEFGLSRHVSGQELCLGLREYAIEQFGPLAQTVLSTMCIHSTSDFGRIVFLLVEVGLMRKTKDDSLDDFCGVFDFAESFGSLLRVS